MEKLNRIKVILAEKDVSQTELAERIGKSFSTINAYCCNRQQPSLEVLSEIAKALSVSLKDLVAETAQ
ncbi:helix-turn-helix transcriptional regulator [Paraprevotella clara]|uniref:DNA-binding helix-turn-helix protein n=1 Tax=Paraprevotella clara YIT 11840 TaxID=762968 RepID=G5ST00_9BACT|nr:helix-turn-helix transcriptional regulator [Paraprevotella clara]EHG99787.1 DNA-binding helix-turn-helix protein [Paraprevotella clara YIT 11840]